MGERRNFSSSFSKFLSFLEKRERSNWKKSKEVLPIFRSFFLDFFFLKTLLFFSFSFFFGRGMESEKDKGICLLEDNPFLQEHSTFLKFIFGEENTPKIHILCQKYA